MLNGVSEVALQHSAFILQHCCAPRSGGPLTRGYSGDLRQLRRLLIRDEVAPLVGAVAERLLRRVPAAAEGVGGLRRVELELPPLRIEQLERPLDEERTIGAH